MSPPAGPAWRAAPDPAIDSEFMRQALLLGERGLGLTAPNPSVGAIVTQDLDGKPVIVGRGFTAPGGRPHGEPQALDRAGALAISATVYVTLEPCAHRSIRASMPCIEYLIRAGVKRVVTSIDDPNPQIAGLGHALLRSAGIRVTTGVRAEEARRTHRGHILRVTQGRPMVTLKLAQTADGYAGGPGGSRMQVSCPLAGHWVHLQRARHDAIMIGVATALADDPQLNVRLPGLEDRSPIRIVLDSTLRLDPDLTLVRTARAIPTWVIAAEQAPVEAERRLVAAGVEVMRVPATPRGHLDLAAALTLLGTRGITRVFSEGGPSVAEALAGAGLADEVMISTAPHRLDRTGITAIRPGLAAALGDATRYCLVSTGMIGEDRLQHFERV